MGKDLLYGLCQLLSQAQLFEGDERLRLHLFSGQERVGVYRNRFD